ncbi:imidazolonepropionase [Lentibacillus kapialis]|uniref:Imidazolonepropionase n=1 Tax=Lentibacillus kapialis TaxID=340214 RepID=A0A917UX86_9BACI|nr:imidazolonepropionase [Lentibacillus kapialis]GGJ94061.1 imidazolonepropionase [Lentibacillus kapialis]
MASSLLIKNASQVVTMAGKTEKPARQNAMQQLNVIENGSVLVVDGKIKGVGKLEELKQRYKDDSAAAEVVDATGKTVTPGLIDPHTHLVHAGTRENEYAMRLKGQSYMEIMNAGGGIHATTRATREAGFDQLHEESKQRLDTFFQYGVTTVEAKSGYGLSLEHELKQLEVAAKLNEDHAMDIVSTFMGAHAVPVDEKENPEPFVSRVIEEMIPEVARRKLADFNDVFCERGVFTPDQSRRILEAGKAHGLVPKIHADEIEPYGGAELAAEVGAISADHLLKASEEGIGKMAGNNVIGVLLPGTAFFLMAEYANARKMIDSGVPVALSTDANPGSSPTLSLQFIMNLGCLKMGMTPEEVLSATTINAAHAINRADTIGSLEVGKQADIAIFDVPNYLMLSYNYGMNHIDGVVKRGQFVVAGGQLEN